jgi:preprotein translocase subunit Sss1
MGCFEVTDLSALTAEKINETIDKFFAGLKIRKTNIDDIINIVKQKILTKNISESKDILTTLQTELTNNEFANESKQIITKARKVSKEEYNDDTLVYQSLFFLANGDVDTFIADSRFIITPEVD